MALNSIDGEELDELDKLLLDIDEPSQEVTPEKDKTDDYKVEKSDIGDDPLNSDPDLDDLGDLDNLDMGDDFDNPILDESTEDYQSVIRKLEEEIKTLRGALNAVKTQKVSTEIDHSDLEFGEETRAFLREYSMLEIEKKEIQQKFKDLKAEFEEQGVHTKEALKAWKEIQKELKETPDEVKEVSQMKNLIKNDDSLYSTVTALIE